MFVLQHSLIHMGLPKHPNLAQAEGVSKPSFSLSPRKGERSSKNSGRLWVVGVEEDLVLSVLTDT